MENVLVTEKFDLKLADFGLSAHIGGAHRKRGVSINRGTCDYFSPEQCLARMRTLSLERQRQLQQQLRQLQQQQPTEQSQQQQRELQQQQQQLSEKLKNADKAIGNSFDEKTDIWMLGVLAFELFFKMPPFGSQCMVQEEEVMQNITSKHWREGLALQAQQNPVLKKKGFFRQLFKSLQQPAADSRGPAAARLYRAAQRQREGLAALLGAAATPERPQGIQPAGDALADSETAPHLAAAAAAASSSKRASCQRGACEQQQQPRAASFLGGATANLVS
ncbi:hypothetical protein Efla_007406 [Eimeria flavescens]